MVFKKSSAQNCTKIWRYPQLVSEAADEVTGFLIRFACPLL